MKQIIIMTALALVLAACGKSNTTKSGSDAVYNNPITGTNTVDVTDYTNFKNKVSNAEFKNQVYMSVEYILNKYEMSVNTDTHKFLGLPVYTSSTNTKKIATIKRVYNSKTNILVHENAANLAALIVYLRDIVNSPSSYYNCKNAYEVTIGGCFVVIKNNIQYRIDLNSPIAVNPTGVYEKVSATSETYLNWEDIGAIIVQ